MKFICGTKILKEVTEKHLPILHKNIYNKCIIIIRFDISKPDNCFRNVSAEISAKVKTKNFTKLGFRVNNYLLPDNISNQQFSALISSLNYAQYNLAIIVQLPLPDHIDNSLLKLIKVHKDIDVLGLYKHHIFYANATAEAVYRVIKPFIENNKKLALVGSKGFIGSSIVRILEKKNVSLIGLDKGDDLMRLHEVDIVISATGQPSLLNIKHFNRNHELVVDVGFSPTFQGRDKKYIICGDVDKEVYRIVKKITPVPGGIGPLEIAVLIERLRTLVCNDNFTKWTIAEGC